MTQKNFIYREDDGMININTLSPSKQFYYKVQKLKALNPSAFGCKIAFYNINDDLIYHRNKVYAHELHDKEEIERERKAMKNNRVYEKSESKSIELVWWSRQGNMVYFLEHFNWNYDSIYDSVILNLKELYCYRINEIENKYEIVDGLKMKNNQYDENEIIEKLDALRLHREKLIKDKVEGDFLDRLINRNKWFP